MCLLRFLPTLPARHEGSRKTVTTGKQSAIQENQRRLTKHIRSSGLHMRNEIPSDGNCLFHAIADQLERLGEKRLNHSDLRKLSVETLKNGVPGVSRYILVLRNIFVGLYW